MGSGSFAGSWASCLCEMNANNRIKKTTVEIRVETNKRKSVTPEIFLTFSAIYLTILRTRCQVRFWALKCSGLGHRYFKLPTSDFDKRIVYFGYKHPFGIDGANRFLIWRTFGVEIPTPIPGPLSTFYVMVIVCISFLIVTPILASIWWALILY